MNRKGGRKDGRMEGRKKARVEGEERKKKVEKRRKRRKNVVKNKKETRINAGCAEGRSVIEKRELGEEEGRLFQVVDVDE
jgi:hypothetical protein